MKCTLSSSVKLSAITLLASLSSIKIILVRISLLNNWKWMQKRFWSVHVVCECLCKTFFSFWKTCFCLWLMSSHRLVYSCWGKCLCNCTDYIRTVPCRTINGNGKCQANCLLWVPLFPWSCGQQEPTDCAAVAKTGALGAWYWKQEG